MSEWIKSAVFYQIFPDRFAKGNETRSGTTRSGAASSGASSSGTSPSEVSRYEDWNSPPTRHGFKGGDFNGISNALDYLDDLGINAIYFNPVFTSTANHRYHTIDYFKIDPILGGNQAFKRFLQNAKSKNIKVVLDGVFNHTGRGFLPFIHTLENGSRSLYKDWFYFNPEWLSQNRQIEAFPANPYSVHDSYHQCGYSAWWNLPDLPKLNCKHPEVRKYILGVAKYWIDQGVDGWRLDVPQEIEDQDFWREFRHVVKTANPDAYIVGEIWDEAKDWLRGDRFDAVMNYLITLPIICFFTRDWHNINEIHKIHNYSSARATTADEFKASMDQYFKTYDLHTIHQQFNLISSHDTPRFLTMCGGNKHTLKLAYLFLFTFPGVPCIYYGDEIGMYGGNDPDCRKAFDWNTGTWDHDLFKFFQTLIAQRKSSVALQKGDFCIQYIDQNLLHYTRTYKNHTAHIALNLCGAPETLPLPDRGSPLGTGSLLLGPYGYKVVV